MNSLPVPTVKMYYPRRWAVVRVGKRKRGRRRLAGVYHSRETALEVARILAHEEIAERHGIKVTPCFYLV